MLARLPLIIRLMFAAAVTAQTTVPADDALSARLAAIDARAASHRDLVASFVQEKASPLLQKPLVTRGVVHARGDVALWASVGSTPTRMRIDPERLRIYYERQRSVEEYPVQSMLAALATSPLPRLATLRERFSIRVDDGPPLAPGAANDDVVQLRLAPADAALTPYVDHVRVLLDATRGLIRVFEVTDADGEQTRVTFADVRTDTDFPASELALNAPGDATVSRPLEAK